MRQEIGINILEFPFDRSCEIRDGDTSRVSRRPKKRYRRRSALVITDRDDCLSPLPSRQKRHERKGD